MIKYVEVGCVDGYWTGFVVDLRVYFASSS